MEKKLDLYLAGELARRGLIPFQKFMEIILYHPQHGYYCREKPVVGKGGDFFTCPAHSPHFGRCLAGYARRVWERLGKPTELALVDLGGGEGHLAASILAEELPFKAVYTIVELSPARQKAQKKRLAPFGAVVQWSSLEELSAFQGLVIANELFDALPVHILEMTGDGLREVYVGMGEGGDLSEALGPVADLEVERALGEVSLPIGRRTQVAPAGRGILAKIASCLELGTVLIIDYGDLSPQRHLSTRYGLRTFFHQFPTNDPYRHLGQQDVTCDVDFSALGDWAREVGFRIEGFLDQGDFLLELGLRERMEQMALVAATDLAVDIELTKLRQLADPFGLGEMFKVMVLEK